MSGLGHNALSMVFEKGQLALDPRSGPSYGKRLNMRVYKVGAPANMESAAAGSCVFGATGECGNDAELLYLLKSVTTWM